MGLSERYGRSWSERILTLIEKLGPFTLGYLEAIIRAADVRASVLVTEDPELAGFRSRFRKQSRCRKMMRKTPLMTLMTTTQN